jgi:hypothetical protein
MSNSNKYFAATLQKVYNNTQNNKLVAKKLRNLQRSNLRHEAMVLGFHKQVNNELKKLKKAIAESTK